MRDRIGWYRKKVPEGGDEALASLLLEREFGIVERAGHGPGVALGLEEKLRAFLSGLIGIGDGLLGVAPFLFTVVGLGQDQSDAYGCRMCHA